MSALSLHRGHGACVSHLQHATRHGSHVCRGIDAMQQPAQVHWPLTTHAPPQVSDRAKQPCDTSLPLYPFAVPTVRTRMVLVIPPSLLAHSLTRQEGRDHRRSAPHGTIWQPPCGKRYTLPTCSARSTPPPRPPRVRAAARPSTSRRCRSRPARASRAPTGAQPPRGVSTLVAAI
eukprot:364376-Chlamydomonas_euryale.AAC.10